MRAQFPAMCAIACLIAVSQPGWAQVQGQWTAAGTMQSARELNAQVPLGGGNAISVGGADSSGNILASAEIYGASTGTWTLAGSMQAAREVFPAAALKSGKILVEGGLGANNAVLGGAELFDPRTNLWTEAGNMSVPRYGHTATLLRNGKVLVAGGCTTINCTSNTATSEIYDPSTNGWSVSGSLNTARSYQTAVLLNSGAVLVIGGIAGGASPSCEIYDPVTGKWTNAASTNVARYLNGTTLLPDGKVLVTGGVITKYPLSSAELYDPAGDTWTLTASMATGRYAHTSTLLADGTVLLAGGFGQSISCGKDCTGFIPTARAEIYNEGTGTFTAAAPLNRALAYQATTSLASGRALVNGGIGYNAYCCQVVNDTEFYIPLTMTFSLSSLDFGLLQIGLTSGSQTVTVTNASFHSATFTGISSSGDFSQSNTCSGTLEPGQDCTITANFKPSVAGSRKGAITIKDNDPGSPKQNIALTGIGETLALAFSPASLKLGSVAVGSSSTQSATLINDGAGAINITAMTISPKSRTFTQTNNCPATLGVQQSCTVQLVFTPPDVFSYKATLSATNSAGPATTLLLSGTGLDGP